MAAPHLSGVAKISLLLMWVLGCVTFADDLVGANSNSNKALTHVQMIIDDQVVNFERCPHEVREDVNKDIQYIHVFLSLLFIFTMTCRR